MGKRAASWRFSVRKLSAGLIALALSACATRQQAYPGAPQPDEATAVIYTTHRWDPLYDLKSRVYEVDGQDMREEYKQEVRILPGTHTVLVGYQATRASLTFTAKAGEQYVVNGKDTYSRKGDPYPVAGYRADDDFCKSVWIEKRYTHEVIVNHSEGEGCK